MPLPNPSQHHAYTRFVQFLSRLNRKLRASAGTTRAPFNRAKPSERNLVAMKAASSCVNFVRSFSFKGVERGQSMRCCHLFFILSSCYRRGVNNRGATCTTRSRLLEHSGASARFGIFAFPGELGSPGGRQALKIAVFVLKLY